MEYMTLSNSNLKVSRLCMGGCPMGGYDWGDVQEQELLDAVHAALDAGINFFDTANTYGFGKSEETLAKGLGAHRHEVVIQSKFGVRVMQDMVGRKTIYDNSPDYIRKALEGTLSRLHTDYIDIYTIHYRDKETSVSEILDCLKDLQKEGKIRYFGLSNIHSENIAEMEEYRYSFVCCQDEYSLARRDYEEDLKMVRDKIGITPLTWGSLGQGILTGKYGRNSKFSDNDRRHRDVYVNFHGEKLEKNLDIVEAIKPIARSYGKPVSAVAIRFILDHLNDSVVLVGAKRAEQVKGNIEAMDWNLTSEELNALDQISK